MSKSGNTYGKVTGDTPKAGVPAERGNPAENEQNILEAAQGATKGAIDDWVESTGYNQGAMIAGAVATAVVEVFMPTAWWELVPVGKAAKIIKKGGEAVGVLNKGEKAAEAAKDAKKAESGGGRKDTQVKKKKRKGGRCELVPYDELECDTGQEAHHVIPDWMLRMGKRGGTERIPDMPSLQKGPAICLEGGRGNEHNTAHKHTDRPAQRIGKNGRATGVPGTITLGQAKGISSRAIEKATGGKKGGGCDRKDIQKQLDEKFKAPDDALLRGVKDARKVTDEIKGAVRRTKGDI